MKCLLCFLLVTWLPAGAQKPQPMTVLDFVRIKEVRFDEALSFYRNNWKAYRDEALRKGCITGYRILETGSDSAAAFHLVSITEYADSLQYNNSGKVFEVIVKRLRPGGPLLPNELKPADFRENLFYRAGKELMAPAKEEK